MKLFNWLKHLFSRRTFRYYPAGYKVESTCVADDKACCDDSVSCCDFDFDLSKPCENGSWCSKNGIPYICKNRKWIVDEEILNTKL